MTSLAMRRFADRLTTVADFDGPAKLPAAIADMLPSLLCVERLLTPAHCEPDPHRYRQHILHVDPAGRFSIVALVWLPGHRTPIHDHVAWCATGVVYGREREQRFEFAGDVPDTVALRPAGEQVNDAGAVSVLPAGNDIHRVRCACDDRTVSIHIYGADIAKLGSSINITYPETVVLPALQNQSS